MYTQPKINPNTDRKTLNSTTLIISLFFNPILNSSNFSNVDKLPLSLINIF